jgi:hypothetical protein
MARIEMTCNRCGAKYGGRSVDEALAWDREHDQHCVALDKSGAGA